MPKLHADTDAIRADLERFRQGLDTTFDAEDVLAALLELDHLRAAVVAYLENDSAANWDALADLMPEDEDAGEPGND